MMRVVAGAARGRRLSSPPGSDVRPTGDRVREAVFNSLGSMDVVRDATVLDLFAGSGALGIEALSRGAARVVFVDRVRRVIDTVGANLERCGLVDGAELVVSDAMAFLDSTQERFDLALLDPPYAFDAWPDLLSKVRASVAVIESDRVVDPEPNFSVVRGRRYGGTVVTIARFADRDDHGRLTPEDRS